MNGKGIMVKYLSQYFTHFLKALSKKKKKTVEIIKFTKVHCLR